MDKIIEETFLNIREEMLERFENISKNIFTSMIYDVDEFDIYTTILPKEDINIFENYLKPVSRSDIRKIDLLETLEKSTDERVFVENLFIESANELENKFITGKIETDKGIFEIKFFLKQNETYKSKMKKLYKLTEKNKVKWKTVNMPHINKFYKLFIVEYDKKLLESTEIKNITYAIEEEYKRNYILVWNIKKILCNGEEYVKPTEEQLTYEYKVKIPYSKKYLVDTMRGELMLSYVVENEYLIFTTENKIKSDINLYEILPKIENDMYDYLTFPIYSNETNTIENSLDLFRNKKEILDTINNIKDIDDIKINNIYSENELPSDCKKISTFNYNFFIKEEFELKDKRDKIHIQFNNTATIYLKELAGYVLSVLNLKNKDFEFIGVE